MSIDAVRLATRTSPLALYQAHRVAERLRSIGVRDVTIVGVESSGDIDKESPIRLFVERGAFTTAVDRMVIEGRADVSVHSAKDLPSSEPTEGVTLAAVPERVDPRDVLVGSRLNDLAPGAVVATGAVRRRVQLANMRPDLGFIELRGNIATRIAKVPVDGAVLVANAALLRLEIPITVGEILPLSLMLSQVGQGAIGLQCRTDDGDIHECLSQIDDVAAHRAVLAERAFLRRLGGGCDAPVAAHASCAGDDDDIEIEAMIASDDGHVIARQVHRGNDPHVVGREIAERLLRHSGIELLGEQVDAR